MTIRIDDLTTDALDGVDSTDVKVCECPQPDTVPTCDWIEFICETCGGRTF
jgi:hypothetical protein